MKKKVLSALLTTAMLASMLVGCGSNNEAPAASTDAAPAASTEAKTEAPASTEAAEPAAAEEGKVFNIYCWNEEFKSRLTDHYPGYEEVDGTTGKIGDITVKWNITPSDDNAYQNNLDETLLKQADAAADDKIDLFLVEADYALKYVDTDYTMPVKDLGITDADLANQYQYTKDVVTDSNGNLKGVSWQATPGLYAYRRSIAKDVLGTDDPAKVQEALADWTKFDEVAAKAADKGYKMLSGYDDAYRTFSNNVSAPWVNDNKEIIVDDNIMKWVDQTKTYTDKGYNNKTSLWSDAWAADQGPDGKVFGFFYSTWGINFTLAGNSLAVKEKDGGKLEVGNGGYGDWAVCYGPQAYFWGGTWMAAAKGTDNAALVGDVLKAFCCDKDFGVQFTKDTQDYYNNEAAMKELASSDFKSAFLGGQNHIALFVETAPKIDMSKISVYDQGLNETFQAKFKEYFDGTVDKDTALKNFYEAAIVKYPELKKPANA